MHRLRPLVSLLMFACGVAHADPVKDLYRAETIVTGTVEPERTRGFRLGLTDVAVKLTGDIRLENNGALAPILEHPHDLVESFEYEDRMKSIPVHDEQGTRERPHFLRIRFKQAELDAALAKLGLTKWTDRPLVAVWMGVRTAARDAVMTTKGNEAYGQRIVVNETAQRRGVPIWIPETAGDVTVDDIASDKAEKLMNASKQAEAWLSGVLAVTDSGYWDITWHLHWHDQSHVWSVKGVSFDVAIREGLQTAAMIFSGHMDM